MDMYSILFKDLRVTMLSFQISAPALIFPVTRSESRAPDISWQWRRVNIMCYIYPARINTDMPPGALSGEMQLNVVKSEQSEEWRSLSPRQCESDSREDDECEADSRC